jgi:hypothetical protein
MAETEDTLENILLNLNNGIKVDDVNITWEFPNLLVNSIEMIVIILTKISCLPVVQDFESEDIRSALNITEEQAKLIQDFNKQFSFIHGLVEKYCIQQYVISSMLKKIMDDTVEDLPELSNDMTKLSDFINNFDENPNTLKGGNPMKYFINSIKRFVYLFCILCLVTSIEPDDKELAVSIVDPKNNQYSQGLMYFSPEQFVKEILSLEPSSSNKVNITSIITKYDNERNRQLQTIIGKIQSLFSNPEFGHLRLETFLEKFNEEWRASSRSIEMTCINLISDAKDKGIFKKYALIDTIEETNEKLEKLNEEVKKTNDDIKKGLIGSATGAVLSAASYDPYSTAAYMYDTIQGLGELLSNSGTKKTDKTKILSEQKTLVETVKPAGIKITAAQREDYANKMANLYTGLLCSNGFNILFELVDGSIQIIGDIVPYDVIINLITTLEQNLDVEIERLSTEQPITESTMNVIMSLDSLQQRLGILKKIKDFLYNLENFSSQIQIMKMAKNPSPRTIDEFENYLNDQLSQLNKLLEDLDKRFPAKEKALEETEQNILKDIELQSKAMNITDLIQNATSIARQRAAERVSKENSDWWLATKTVGQSFMDIGLNATFFAKDNLKKYTGSIMDLAFEGPTEIFDSILRFLNNILYSLLSNPSGWVLLMGCLFVVEFTIGGVSGTIRIFKQGGKLFIAIATKTLLFVYELIRTPFGLIYRHIATLFIRRNTVNIDNTIEMDYGIYGEENYNRFLRQQEEGEIYSPDKQYGGKRRKTRKNRKRITRKLKHGKKRNTKHRRMRPTKRT